MRQQAAEANAGANRGGGPNASRWILQAFSLPPLQSDRSLYLGSFSGRLAGWNVEFPTQQQAPILDQRIPLCGWRGPSIVSAQQILGVERLDDGLDHHRCRRGPHRSISGVRAEPAEIVIFSIRLTMANRRLVAVWLQSRFSFSGCSKSPRAKLLIRLSRMGGRVV